MSDATATEQPAPEVAEPAPVEAVEPAPVESAGAAGAEEAEPAEENVDAEGEGVGAGGEGEGAENAEAEAEADAEAAGDEDEDGENEEEMRQQVAAKIAAIIAAGDETITMRMVKEELQASFGDSVYTQYKQFIKDTVQQEIERKESQAAEPEPEPEAEQAEEPEEPSEAEEPEPEDDDDDDGARKKRNKHSDKGRKKKRQKHRRDESGDEEEDKPTQKKRKRKDGPQRPRSAFNFFSTDNRKNISKLNPDASFGEVSKLVADRWKALSSSDKKPYEQRAKEDKARYEDELKEYLASNPEAAEKFKSKKSKEGSTPRKKKATSGSESSDDEKAPAGPKTKFEEVMDALKPKRKRKSDLSDEDQQKRVQLFIMRMQDAANKDLAAMKEGTPAIFKLQMVKDVEEQVAKKLMQETMIDKGLLAMLKIWLSPLVDAQHPSPGALPNKNLREAIFGMLESLHITDQHLEKSEGLGQVVAMIAQHPQETPQNKQRLKLLMQKWCRHLFGKDATANYKLLEEVERERQREIQERRAALASSNAVAQNLHKSDDSSRRRARIPQAATFDYAIRPSNNDVAPAGRDRPQKEASAQKMNLMRTLKSRSSGSKSDQAHAAEVSLTKI